MTTINIRATQPDAVFAFVFVLPNWLCCSAVGVNVSFKVSNKLVNKFGSLVLGCALATTPLVALDYVLRQNKR